MLFRFIVFVLLIITGAAICYPEESGVSNEQVNHVPQLRMVVIRAKSSLEVKQLRDMKLNIIKSKPDPNRPPNNESLSGGFIVEAVVTHDMLTRLKAKKFEVIEVPQQKSKVDHSP
jgi:hypothetical protein